MPLPPLYKYLDYRGAELTLRNGTFKHAKPSDFNDVEDLTVRGLFPEDVKTALTYLERSFFDILLEHLDVPPVNPEYSQKLSLIQAALKTHPEKIENLRAAHDDAEPIFDRDHMNAITQNFIQTINDFMQGYRIFCVTTQRNSTRMWEEYGGGHHGIVLRIAHERDPASMFTLFNSVDYQDARPTFYSDVRSFIVDALFTERSEIVREAVDRITYTKTRTWEHEAEYRLSIPTLDREPDWDILAYNPDNISELYLGANMTPNERVSIVALARARNPNIAVFQVHIEPDRTVRYSRYP